MNKDELKNLSALIAEQRLIKKAMDKLPIVYDSVKGSRTEMPYDLCVIPIKGASQTFLDKLSERYSENLKGIENQIAAMEDFINEIEDPKLRIMIRMKYREGRTDEAIGYHVGYNRETVNRKINEFISNK